MSMFQFIAKQIKETVTPNCKDCFYYGSVVSEDKLNPDKTVAKGKAEYEFCNKGTFYLTEYKPCSLYEELTEGTKRSVRIMPPPVPRNSL